MNVNFTQIAMIKEDVEIDNNFIESEIYFILPNDMNFKTFLSIYNDKINEINAHNAKLSEEIEPMTKELSILSNQLIKKPRQKAEEILSQTFRDLGLKKSNLLSQKIFPNVREIITELNGVLLDKKVTNVADIINNKAIS
jgi:hypothetical protein